MESVAAKSPQATSKPKDTIRDRFPHWTRADRNFYSRIREITDWCDKKFGQRMRYSKKNDHWVYSQRWYYDQMFGYTTFYFAKEKDLLFFKLYWGEMDDET